jgi:hypothetical protein
MWEIGKEINQAVKESSFGFDELLRTLYDPHGKKITYITRDLGSYSHRVFLYFKNKEDIKNQFKGLSSYTLFREAFPLLTNKQYKLTDKQKSEIIKLVVSTANTKSAQSEIKKIKQSIRPIKNTRVSKSSQYQNETKWLTNLREKVIEYYRNNENFNPSTFPINKKDIEELRIILKALAYDQKLDGKIKEDEITDLNLKHIAKIANSSTEDKARFKKWGMDTYKLMTFAEMLNALNDENKFAFVRKKVIN